MKNEPFVDLSISKNNDMLGLITKQDLYVFNDIHNNFKTIIFDTVVTKDNKYDNIKFIFSNMINNDFYIFRHYHISGNNILFAYSYKTDNIQKKYHLILKDVQDTINIELLNKDIFLISGSKTVGDDTEEFLIPFYQILNKDNIVSEITEFPDTVRPFIHAFYYNSIIITDSSAIVLKQG